MFAPRGNGGNQNLLEQKTRAMGHPGGFGEKRLDGAGGFDRFVAEPAGQSLELGGVLGQLGDAAIVDQAQPVLDRAQEVVGVAQLVVDLGTQDPVPAERREGVPEIGPQQVGLASGRARATGIGR